MGRGRTPFNKTLMGTDKPAERLPSSPQTRTELEGWIHDRLTALAPEDRDQLIAAIDGVFTRHQRLWQQSKEEAVQALSAAFTDNLARLRTELSAKDATVCSVARYFEDLVEHLTERSHIDPKTKLMNFDWFMEQLESFLELEQRVQYCAVGLSDIARFKWYNDQLGHAVGDRVLEQVARLLREHIRSNDVMVQELAGGRRVDLHARFGGDEFCFLIRGLAGSREATAVAERFRNSVVHFGWSDLSPALADQPVRVDVGVACLRMGPVGMRRDIARRVALELVEHADQLMYRAKAAGSVRVHAETVAISNGTLAVEP